MGMNLTAFVFYGLEVCGPGDDPPWDPEGDGDIEWEEVLLATAGLEWSQRDQYDEKEYWEKRKAAKAGFAVDVEFMGVGDYVGRALVFAPSVLESDWSALEPIDGLDLSTPEGADEKLKWACELLGIEWVQPRWYLAGRYW